MYRHGAEQTRTKPRSAKHWALQHQNPVNFCIIVRLRQEVSLYWATRLDWGSTRISEKTPAC